MRKIQGLFKTYLLCFFRQGPLLEAVSVAAAFHRASKVLEQAFHEAFRQPIRVACNDADEVVRRLFVKFAVRIAQHLLSR